MKILGMEICSVERMDYSVLDFTKTEKISSLKGKYSNVYAQREEENISCSIPMTLKANFQDEILRCSTTGKRWWILTIFANRFEMSAAEDSLVDRTKYCKRKNRKFNN